MWFYITKLLKWVPIYINFKKNNNKKLGGPLPPRPSLPDVVHNISLLFVVFLWWIVSEGTTCRDVVWVYLMTQVEISEMCVPIMEFCSSLSVHRSSSLFFFQTNVLYIHIIFTIWQVITGYYYWGKKVILVLCLNLNLQQLTTYDLLWKYCKNIVNIVPLSLNTIFTLSPLQAKHSRTNKFKFLYCMDKFGTCRLSHPNKFVT